ncbi:MAG: c-type cytochrome, partial [Candidatus Dormibacteraceae bacterium]
QPVTLELETADVIHSFWVPALHGKVDMIPGHPNFIRIEANHEEMYKGQCSSYCGKEHALMRLVVIADPPAQYQTWLTLERQAGAEPTTAQAIQGEQVFLSAQCAECHSVRGTSAAGLKGPDLTHIGSRLYLASNVYPNNDAYLAAWITHAQSLKPGALMPDLPDYTGKQLLDRVAFLRQLK